jgi:hypothetical protein
MNKKKRYARRGRFTPSEYKHILGGLINIINWTEDTITKMLDFVNRCDYKVSLKGIRLFRKIFIGSIKVSNTKVYTVCGVKEED